LLLLSKQRRNAYDSAKQTKSQEQNSDSDSKDASNEPPDAIAHKHGAQDDKDRALARRVVVEQEVGLKSTPLEDLHDTSHNRKQRDVKVKNCTWKVWKPQEAEDTGYSKQHCRREVEYVENEFHR